MTPSVIPVAPVRSYSPHFTETFSFSSLADFKNNTDILFHMSKCLPLRRHCLNWEAFLNLPTPLPKSTERNPESHSIWLCRRLQAVFMGDIEQWFLWHCWEGRGWREECDERVRADWEGYLGLGNCVFLLVCACVCVGGMNIKLEAEKIKWRKADREQQRLRKEKPDLVRFVCWMMCEYRNRYVLPYPAQWTASCSPQWAGLFPSRTSACTRSQTLPVHFGWRKHIRGLLNFASFWIHFLTVILPRNTSSVWYESWPTVSHTSFNSKTVTWWSSFLPPELKSSSVNRSRYIKIHQIISVQRFYNGAVQTYNTYNQTPPPPP